MYIVIYCSFISPACIFIFYFSSEILAKFSYSVNPRLNKVYVCTYVTAARPEMGGPSEVLDIHMETLINSKSRACSETNFAVQLFKIFFKDEQRRNKNFSRAKGKEPLDLVRIEKINQYLFQIYPVWRKMIRR